MRLQDLHVLPKTRDSLSYLYVEHCRVDQEDKAIAIHDAAGVTPVPCAALALLMLGPGVNITHAAVLALADNDCLVCWVGEMGVRFYAAGSGATRGARNLIHQARLVSRRSTRLQVVRRLYEMRFGESLDPALSLEQIRGREGARVRDAYAHASAQSGVPWSGRSYDRGSWGKADPVNRALSAANSCLYGLCQAAIVSAGYSPALGFIHTGKQLSFVYDVADIYKTDLTVPMAFEVAGQSDEDLERRVRYRCRDRFAEVDLLGRVVNDIDHALDIPPAAEDADEPDFDADPAAPGALWDPQQGMVAGGTDYGTPRDAAAEGGEPCS